MSGPPPLRTPPPTPHPHPPPSTPCHPPATRHYTQTEADYEKEKLNERIARLSGGVAVIQARVGQWGRRLGRGTGRLGARRPRPALPAALTQPSLPCARLESCRPQVGAQTETELKEKKLRVEDALNATKVRVLAERASAPASRLLHARSTRRAALPRPTLPARPSLRLPPGKTPSPRAAGRGGGGHRDRRRLHAAAPVQHGGRLQGHAHRRGAEGGSGREEGCAAAPGAGLRAGRGAREGSAGRGERPRPRPRPRRRRRRPRPPRRRAPAPPPPRSAPTSSSARCPTA